MASTKITETRADVAELRELLNKATRKRVQDFLSLEISKLETKLINLAEEEAKPVPIVASTSTNIGNKRYQVKLNGYGWDQSDKYVKIFVTLKNAQNIPKESIFCKLTERSMELNVENLDNKDYLLVIKNLLYTIDVAASYWKQKTDMVVVFLAKAKPNQKWSHMTEIEKRFEDNKSNKFKPSNDKEADPQDSIMSLMKNMYESGDDDMKRMIAKAWTEGQDKRKTNTGDLDV